VAQSGLTAPELYQAANTAFNSREYAKAAEYYSEFERLYGTSLEAKEAMRIVLPNLALSHIRLKQFEQALDILPRALALDDLDSRYQEDLLFWLGAAQLQTRDLDSAFAAFTEFGQKFPDSEKFAEAGLLAATVKIVEQDWSQAAHIAGAIKNRLEPVNRGRAVILELYGLVQADELDDALTLLTDEYSRIDQIVQLAAFQLIAMQLGSAFLEQERYREAIGALQRIWDQERLLRHQEDRLDILRQQQLALERANTPQAAIQLYQLNQLIAKIEREIDSISKIENYDSALRMRLATAFLGLQRYREGALVLNEMLRKLPANPIVEGATQTLIKAWFAIERWPRAVEAADAFAEKFPNSDTLPLVLYMKGQAQQNDGLYNESIETLSDLVRRFPKTDITPRAIFLQGFGHLLNENYEIAEQTFDQVLDQYPNNDIGEAALYWRGMTFSLAKQFERAREALANYLEEYPKGRYQSQAVFRRAYCAQSMLDFSLAITELNDYLQRFPAGVNRDEALLLLGDAYMDEGEIEQGIASLKKIDPTQTKFFEEGWFKIGKALRLLEDPDGLAAHMQQFRTQHPRSPRVAEAVYWIGWTHRQAGDTDAARDVYWDAIRQLGPDGTIRSVEDLFPALAKLYQGDRDREIHRRLLTDLQEEAVTRDQPILRMRALWAEAKWLERTNPSLARAKMTEAAQFIDVETTNPLILDDVAAAYLERGELLEARDLYADLIKWNPRAPQKADAYAQLGLIALHFDEEREALEAFAKFDQTTMGSRLLGRVMLARADLLAKRGEMKEAQEALEKLLAQDTVAGSDKAAALLAIGELHMTQDNPGKAVAYFQRLYVLYGRWTDYVAQAYLRSGDAFEALDDQDAAIKTYQEMLAREELADTKEVEEARARLTRMGADHAPQPTPAEMASQS